MPGPRWKRGPRLQIMSMMTTPFSANGFNTSFVTKTRRHRRETRSANALHDRLAFLRSRLNSHSDPVIRALIERTEEALARCASPMSPGPAANPSLSVLSADTRRGMAPKE